jgi:hypothetical protein
MCRTRRQWSTSTRYRLGSERHQEGRKGLEFAFGEDWDDPARYDPVLNVDNLSVTLAITDDRWRQ